jgi:hypothetical protein
VKRTEEHIHTVTWEMDGATAAMMEGLVTAYHDWVYSNPKDSIELGLKLNMVNKVTGNSSRLSNAMSTLVTGPRFNAWRKVFNK